MVAISERPVVRTNDLEIKRLDIKIGHRVGVLRGDGDVAQLGHVGLLSCRWFNSPSLRANGGPGRAAKPKAPGSRLRRKRRMTIFYQKHAALIRVAGIEPVGEPQQCWPFALAAEARR